MCSHQILNQVKQNDNEDGEEDESNGKSFIKIELNGNVVSATMNSGVTPSRTEIKEGKEKSVNEQNELSLNVFVGNKKQEIEENEITVKSDDLFTKFPDLLNPEVLLSGQTAVDNAQTELTNAENAYKANRNNNQLRKNYNIAKNNLETEQQKFNLSKKGKESKIKVEAFLIKNKKKTKVTKTFTVTENGIN